MDPVKPKKFTTIFSQNPVLTYCFADGSQANFLGGEYTPETQEQEDELMAAIRSRSNLLGLKPRPLWGVVNTKGNVTVGIANSESNLQQLQNGGRPLNVGNPELAKKLANLVGSQPAAVE